MAFISYISFNNASDRLKRLYKLWVEPDGALDNIVKITGHNPGALEYRMKCYKVVMNGPSSLSRWHRELIAIVVSGINHCHY